jgi:hypothetical protein
MGVPYQSTMANGPIVIPTPARCWPLRYCRRARHYCPAKLVFSVADSTKTENRRRAVTEPIECRWRSYFPTRLRILRASKTKLINLILTMRAKRDGSVRRSRPVHVAAKTVSYGTLGRNATPRAPSDAVANSM